MSHLSCPRAWQLYGIESLHSPGHSVGFAVLRDEIKETMCALHGTNISYCKVTYTNQKCNAIFSCLDLLTETHNT